MGLFYLYVPAFIKDEKYHQSVESASQHFCVSFLLPAQMRDLNYMAEPCPNYNRDVPTYRLHTAQAHCFLVYKALLKSIKVQRATSSDALALRVVAMWGHHDA